MKNIPQSLTALAITALSLGLVNRVAAQDWPQWRGANRDGKVTGFNAPAKWPTSLTQKWKTTVGAGDASPALVGNKLYVFTRQGDEEVLQCLNTSDGKELWQKKYAAQAVTGPAGRHPGPRSSPTVAEGKVVTLGVGGVLACFDAASGKELWRKDEFPKVVPQFFTAMSPIVAQGLCLAHLGGKENGAVMAFDLTTGEVKWKWQGDGPAYASPVLLTVAGTRQVVVQTDKSLIGFGLTDGKLLWQVASPPQGRAYNSATPIVEGDTVYYTGQGKGIKAVKIEKQGDAFVIRDLWANDQVGSTYNTPVLKDGLLFGLSDKGNLFCLKAKTGESAWTDSVKRDSFGAVVDAGSALVALPGTGELVAFKPSDKQFEELTRIKVSDAQVYAHPVLAGNRIFVKDRDAVTLWTLD